MKQQIARVLNRNIISNDTMLSVVQIMCFGLSIVAFALTSQKLSRLDLTEAQLFFGVLLSVIVSLLFIVLGLLLPLSKTVKSA
jgi:hypothetical protein